MAKRLPSSKQEITSSSLVGTYSPIGMKMANQWYKCLSLVLTAEEEPSTFHMNKTTSNFQKSLITQPNEQLKTNDNCKITQPEQINLEIIEHLSRIFQNQPSPNTQLAGKFIGIRGALNRTKPSNNDPGATVAAQSLNDPGDCQPSSSSIYSRQN